MDEKSNEIPAVQELLKKLDIEGCLVVADALNCQKETAESIVSGKGDYLLAAKGNQPSLEQEISDYVQDETPERGWTAQSKRENRDRIETRTAYTVSDISWLFGKEKWKNLACIGAIRTEVEKNGEKTDEWHYYISSRKLSAEELLHHARMEWTVETMHWILDVHYGEDFCRIENKTIQQNLNMLRKFTISLIKQHKNRTGSKRAMSKIMLIDGLAVAERGGIIPAEASNTRCGICTMRATTQWALGCSIRIRRDGPTITLKKNVQGDVIGVYQKEGDGNSATHILAARYSYDPYGNPTSMTNGAGTAVSQTSNTIAAINPFRYRGYRYDGGYGAVLFAEPVL